MVGKQNLYILALRVESVHEFHRLFVPVINGLVVSHAGPVACKHVHCEDNATTQGQPDKSRDGT